MPNPLTYVAADFTTSGGNVDPEQLRQEFAVTSFPSTPVVFDRIEIDDLSGTFTVSVYFDTVPDATDESTADGVVSAHDAAGPDNPEPGDETPSSAGGILLANTWTFDSATADADPGAGKFRLNNATQSSSNFIYVAYASLAGPLMQNIFIKMHDGSVIYLQDINDSSRHHMMQVNGNPIATGAYVKIPCFSEQSGSDLLDGSTVGWLINANSTNEWRDSFFRVTDLNDTSKKISFDAGSISAGTLRVISVPDSSLTLLVPAGLAGGQSIVGGTAAGEDLTLESTSNATKGDVALAAGSPLLLNDMTAPANPSNGQGRLYKKTGDDGLFWLPDSAGPEVDLTGGGGSDFTDDVFRISDDGDNTKKIAFQASGITASTVRTITMPDSDLTLLVPAGLAGGQSIVGGTASGEDLTLESTSNATKGSVVLAAGTNLDVSDEDVIGVKTLTSSGPETQTTSGSTLTIDLSAGMHHRITLASNITTVNITDPAGPGHFTLEFIQDATGGRTLTGWPANVFWSNGVQPVFGDAANARRIVALYYNGPTEDDYYGEFRLRAYT